MTDQERTQQHRTPDQRYGALAERFRPVFARIGADSRERERREDLATEQLGWLVDAGFARLRTPEERGGLGAALSDVFRLVADLATEDPNLAHVWRNHFSFVEDRLHADRGALDDDLIERLGRGEVVGGGWSETTNTSAADITTTLRRDPGGHGWRVSGAKYYSTGSVYARWITVLARGDDGDRYVALVDAEDQGVVVGDDWDGFGQRVTGSGSVRYDDVLVPDDRVLAYADRYPYQEHYYQTAMHAILVGIGRALLRDGIAALRARTRGHRNGTTDDPSRDPEVLATIGTVSARLFAAESAFAASLPPIDRLVDAHAAGDPAEDTLATSAWIAVADAQTVISDAVLDAATLVFDALGASGTNRSIALDRHWRNARTLASHNPRIHKRRIVGDWLVNGTDPVQTPAEESAAEHLDRTRDAAARGDDPTTPAHSPVVGLGDVLLAEAIGRPDGLRRIAAGLARAGVRVAVVGTDRFRPDVAPDGPRVDPTVAALALAQAAPGLGVLAAASPTRDHPYNTARRILSADHLTDGRVGVVYGLEDRGAPASPGTGTPWTDRDSGPELVDEAADALRGLWNTWPIESIVADRDAGVFADPASITRLDHEGAYRIAGPLNTPSSAQGEPVLATWGDLGVPDAELVLDADWVVRVDSLAELDRLSAGGGGAGESRASSPSPDPGADAPGGVTLRALLGLAPRRRDTASAAPAFGGDTIAVGSVSVSVGARS